MSVKDLRRDVPKAPKIDWIVATTGPLRLPPRRAAACRNPAFKHGGALSLLKGA